MRNGNLTAAGSKSARRLALQALPLALALIGTGVHAAPTVYLSDDTTLDYSLTLSYTASARTKKADREYLADPNGDDGTRNFKRGALVNNRASALGEILLRHDNVGAMLRGSTFYDSVYRSSNDNNSPETVNKSGQHDHFTSRASKRSGNDSQLLEAYVYGNWPVGEQQYLSLKAGRHVVAWGESMYFANISQGQMPIDATKFNVPGTEIKEAFLPVGQVSANWSLNNDLTLTGYYQYKWEKARLNPVGDFFSTFDAFGPGTEFMILGPGFNVMNAGQIKAKDSGQWGLGVRYQISDATELGVFHHRYHDRFGSLLTDFTGTTQYSSFKRFGRKANPADAPYMKFVYFEDIRLTGMSLSTKVGDSVQFGGDLSYRDGQAVTLENGAPARGQYGQLNVNSVYMIGPSSIAHQTTLTGELMYQRILGVDSLRISGGMPGQDGKFSKYTYKGQTRSSTLLALGAIFDYPNIIDGWDLSTNVSWMQNLSGQGDTAGGMGRGDKNLTLGANVKYLGNLTLGLTWVNYLGSASAKHGRMMADRDYVSFNAKYTF